MTDTDTTTDRAELIARALDAAERFIERAVAARRALVDHAHDLPVWVWADDDDLVFRALDYAEGLQRGRPRCCIEYAIRGGEVAARDRRIAARDAAGFDYLPCDACADAILATGVVGLDAARRTRHAPFGPDLDDEGLDR